VRLELFRIVEVTKYDDCYNVIKGCYANTTKLSFYAIVGQQSTFIS